MITFLTKTSPAFILFFVGMFYLAPSVHAYFYDIEVSDEMSISAGTLEITLNVLSSTATSRTLEVSNESTNSFNYEAYVTETSDPLVSFCDEVNVTLDGSETDLLSFMTPSVLLAVGDAENLGLEFSVDDPHVDLDGKTCTVEFVFEASQEGFNHGEAFYDTETYILTLYGEDFTTDDPGDDELTAEDCKDGGWESEIFAEFEFKNQGHCVSHFASGGVSTDARNKNKSAEETILKVELLGRPLLTQMPLIEEIETETLEDGEEVVTEEPEEAKPNDDDEGVEINSEGGDEGEEDEGHGSHNEESVFEEEEEEL